MLRSTVLFTLLGFNLAVQADGAPACKNNVAALDTEFQAAVAKNDAATYFHIHTLSEGPDKQLGLLVPERVEIAGANEAY